MESDVLILLLLGNLALSLMMTAILWVTQLVSYPLFARVPAGSFVAYHQGYMRRIGWIVGPVLLLELVLAVWLAVLMPTFWFAALSLGPIVAAWVITAAISGPCHHRLKQGFDRKVWQVLVQTNWIRVAAWTLRVVGLVFLLGLIVLAGAQS